MRAAGLATLVSALPSLHPAVVHFPIALLVTASIFDAAAFLARRHGWLDRAALALYALGLVSGLAAVLTGRLAAAAALGPDAGELVRAAVAAHEQSAFFTLAAFVGVALLRVEAAWRDRKAAVLTASRPRRLALVAALGAQLLLYQTAERGAALVFRHGVGVEGWREASPRP